MFWGDEDEERARHSLSDALSHLRRVLGRDAIAARSEVVTLEAAGRLAVDAVEFEAAVESHDWVRATELYQGQFLADLYVDRAPSFEAWVSRERARFARFHVQSCERGTVALARAGDWLRCRSLASRWLTAAPQSADAALHLLRAAAALGDRESLRTALSE